MELDALVDECFFDHKEKAFISWEDKALKALLQKQRQLNLQHPKLNLTSLSDNKK